MMSVSDLEVSVIPAHDMPVLRHLVDFYVYDLSGLMNLDVGDDGRFAFGDLDPWFADPARYPFFARVGGKLAGFALVQDRSRLSGRSDVHDMAEFFVMRRFRGQGIGARIAGALFDRFPGAWEIRQRPHNIPATAFWRRVIDRYTAGHFREVVWDDDTWQGPVQFFSAAPRR